MWGCMNDVAAAASLDRWKAEKKACTALNGLIETAKLGVAH